MKRTYVIAALGLVAILVASMAAVAATTQNRPPFVVKRSWGTFRLADRVAEKVRAGEKINYVFSYQASGIPLFSQQYQQGYDEGLAAGTKIYPLSGQAIAPVQTNPNQQVAQIEAQLAAGKIDCLGIEPATSDAFTAITNKIMDQGIPVFTAGVTSRGHEFTNFTQVPAKEGATAAKVVLDWMKANKKRLRVFAVSGGDPAQFWAQGRMKSFVDTIRKAIPNARFVNTQGNALNTSYDPAKTYDNAKAFLSANPDVQFMENVDIGAEHIDKAIVDLGKKGKVFTIGWNVSKANLDYIEQGVQVATLDQRWAEQAAFGAKACATFLKTGRLLANTQVLEPILKRDVRAARADLDRILRRK